MLILCGGLSASCGGRHGSSGQGISSEPRFLKVDSLGAGAWRLVSVSPFDGSSDTLTIDRPLGRLIVMSTSHVGFLEAIGRPDVIVGVSGLDYLYSDSFCADEGTLGGSDVIPVDVGYDTAPDYEKIVALKPDLLLAYSVSAARSPFMERLDQLGIRVFVVNEHLESHPLARAAYIRLFGALTGSMEAADSVLDDVTVNYLSLARTVSESAGNTRKVLMNIPYNDQWFVPSKENYLTSLVEDAGGTVLGGGSGKAASSVMSLERAYSFSKEADLWLNTGWCRTMEQLLSVNPLFADMVRNVRQNADAAGFKDSPVAWNDNKRVSPKGGNDIWQSGVVRPDLVLRDLVGFFHPGLIPEEEGTTYYWPLD